MSTHLLRENLQEYYNKKMLDSKEFIGDYSYGRPALQARASSSSVLKVGKFCSIGRNVSLLLDGGHRPEWVSTFPFQHFWPDNKNTNNNNSKGDIVIGNDVWIGAEVIVLSGVTIGDGAVIGAGAVVTKNIPPYAIAAGNPARVIKMRFSEDKIKKLLNLRWWDWPIENILKNIHILQSCDLESLFNIDPQIEHTEDTKTEPHALAKLTQHTRGAPTK